MKLFGSFKLTDRIRIGASSGGRRRSSRSSKSGATGCLSIFIVLCVICIPISLIRSCVKGDDDETTTETTTLASKSGITALEFLSTDDLELKVGENKWSWFKVEASDEYEIDDIVFISSDEDVATFTFDEISLTSYVYYYIDAVAPGTATVHAETADGKVKSDAITVIVTEEETTEEETTEEETTTSEPDTTKKADVTTKKADVTTKKADVTTKKQTSGKTVYRTPSGKRYHFDPDCGGKNSYSVSLDDAKNSGLTPCQKCAD